MNITILCSSRAHPVWPRLVGWCARLGDTHTISLVESLREVTSGDILFLISCNQIVKQDVRRRFQKVLVIHASDVPYGRGFAPLNWQILEGRSEVVVTLMEAADKVDSGDVWQKRTLHFNGSELFNELFDCLFAAELALMDFAVDNFRSINPQPQPSIEGSYYPKRGPEDSRVQPTQTIAEIFDLVRVSDPARYPVFFDHRGCRYTVQLQKLNPTPLLPVDRQ
jgi:methionyl-tRNA formyltransferase